MNHYPLARFLAVVDAGSLNKAADVLHISQPALTKSIQQLEERLGVALLSRSQRGVRLTPYGEAVLTRARLIESETRKLHAEIDALRNLDIGEVNVGAVAGPGFQSRVLPAATSQLIQEGGRLNVNYSMGTREQLLPELRQGRLDFIIAVIELDESSADLLQEPLFRDRNSIVVRAGHPLQALKSVRLADLVQYPWAVLSESLATERLLRSKAQTRRQPMQHSTVRSGSSNFVKSQVLVSDCVGVVRHDVVRAELERGVLAELGLADRDLSAKTLGFQTVGLISRVEAVMSPAALRLISEIRSQASAAQYRMERG